MSFMNLPDAPKLTEENWKMIRNNIRKHRYTTSTSTRNTNTTSTIKKYNHHIYKRSMNPENIEKLPYKIKEFKNALISDNFKFYIAPSYKPEDNIYQLQVLNGTYFHIVYNENNDTIMIINQTGSNGMSEDDQNDLIEVLIDLNFKNVEIKNASHVYHITSDVTKSLNKLYLKLNKISTASNNNNNNNKYKKLLNRHFKPWWRGGKTRKSKPKSHKSKPKSRKN